MASLLFRLGQFSARRHWLVIVSWAVIIGVAALTFSMFSGPISTALSIPGTKTDEVQAQLEEECPEAQGGSGTVVFATADGTPFSEDQEQAIGAFLDGLNDIPGVKDTVDGFETQHTLGQQRDEISAGQAQLDEAQAQLDEQQAQLDAQIAQAGPGASTDPQFQQAQQALDEAQEELDRNATQLEQGAALLGLSEGIRFVSEDGSAAIGTVTFTANTDEVPQDTETAIAELDVEDVVTEVHVGVITTTLKATLQLSPHGTKFRVHVISRH